MFSRSVFVENNVNFNVDDLLKSSFFKYDFTHFEVRLE